MTRRALIEECTETEVLVIGSGNLALAVAEKAQNTGRSTTLLCPSDVGLRVPNEDVFLTSTLKFLLCSSAHSVEGDGRTTEPLAAAFPEVSFKKQENSQKNIVSVLVPVFSEGTKAELTPRLEAYSRTNALLPEALWKTRNQVLFDFPGFAADPTLMGGFVVYGNRTDVFGQPSQWATLSTSRIIPHVKISRKLFAVDEFEKPIKRVIGVMCEDSLHKHAPRFEIRADVIFEMLDNPWEGLVSNLGGSRQGLCVVLPARFGPTTGGFCIPCSENEHAVFGMPWLDNTVVVGTTDEVCEDDTLEEEDVLRVLSRLNLFLKSKARCGLADVMSVWYGRIPRISEQSKSNQDDAVIQVLPSGVISCCVSENPGSIDALTREAIQLANLGPCVFPDLELATEFQQAFSFPEHHFFPHYTKELLLKWDSGFTTRKVLEVVAEETGTEVLHPRYSFLSAQVVVAARTNLASTVEDVLWSRVPLAMVDVRAAAECVSKVAKLMRTELGWSSWHTDDEEQSALTALQRLGLHSLFPSKSSQPKKQGSQHKEQVLTISKPPILRRGPDGLPRPMICAHRGASGYFPAHVLPGYDFAIESGADYIEFDVVSTKDHHLIICHDLTLDDSSNCAEVFPGRERTRKTPAVDGDPLEMTGHFACDYTLAEVKKLHATEHMPFRSKDNDKQHRLLGVLEAAIYLEQRRSQCDRNFGLVVEVKRGLFHAQQGLAIEDKLIAALEQSGFGGPIIIQNFEENGLREIMQKKPEWRRMKLCIDPNTCKALDLPAEIGLPVDDVSQIRKYLERVAEYAHILAPWKVSLVPDPENPPLGSAIVDLAHELGMEVTPYTFRSDMYYLHRCYAGNAVTEYSQFFRLQVDGMFSDFSSHCKTARDMYFTFPHLFGENALFRKNKKAALDAVEKEVVEDLQMGLPMKSRLSKSNLRSFPSLTTFASLSDINLFNS